MPASIRNHLINIMRQDDTTKQEIKKQHEHKNKWNDNDKTGRDDQTSISSQFLSPALVLIAGSRGGVVHWI